MLSWYLLIDIIAIFIKLTRDYFLWIIELVLLVMLIRLLLLLGIGK